MPRNSWAAVSLLLLVPLLVPVLAVSQEAPSAAPPRLIVTEGEEVLISILSTDGEIEVVRLAPERLVLPIFAPFATVSPDGRTGTFVTAQGATPEGVSLDGAVLWLVDMEGGRASAAWHFADRLWPAAFLWSPDSTRLAFVQIPADPVAAGRGELELWSLDVRNGQPTLLVRDPSFTAELFYQEAPPQMRWSPAGDAFPGATHSAGALHLEEQPPLAADEGAAEAAGLPCTVRRFSQHDPRWGAQKMQSCGLTISQAGCALTATAMVFRYYGQATDPGALNGCLGNYACPIYWGVAASRCGAGRVSSASTAAFSWSRLEQELSRGVPPIVYLCKYDDCSRYTHWVVAVGGAGSAAGGYTINDPADGQKKSLAAYTNSGWVPQSLRLYGGRPGCDLIVAKARVYLPLVVGGR